MDATLHHVAISASDIDRAVSFYRDVLGFAVDWDMDHRSGEALSRVVGLPDADMRIVMMMGYGFRVELFKYYTPEGKGTAAKRMCDFGYTHFALSVKNIHEIYERLLKAGVQFNCPPQNLRPGVCVTYMKDPEGNTIELVEYSEV
jgi:catechol 2,3-dioxygenase-like lactoylglutathione lyase family enzyme